jgi:hypothetical protein
MVRTPRRPRGKLPTPKENALDEPESIQRTVVFALSTFGCSSAPSDENYFFFFAVFFLAFFFAAI